MIDIKTLANQYKSALLDNVLPFWMNNSIDVECGGFYTCLDRHGKVFDTDKFLWLQGRQVWTFATMYNQVAQDQRYLDVALHGAAFLEKYGSAEDGTFYFSLTREGKPLIHPYNIFSDCFATQAFGQLYKASGEMNHAEMALRTFQSIIDRRNNPKRNWSKSYPGTRPLKNFSLPMILCNLGLELEHLLGSSEVDRLADECIHEVMEIFFDRKSGLILENVTPEGQFSDSFEGRLLNPGHAIEAMWFIMDIGARKNDHALILRAKEIMLNTLEYAWDKEYEGILYFMDVKGAPPQQLEWDQKLWWVHVETLIALAKAYKYTGDEQCLTWFEKVHNYSWSHFADPENGEWFGYLNRRGEVLLPLKGGKWKGCYHVPRAMLQVWKTLESIEG
jgi:N-acylglucosamine 2-epimerase